MTSELKRGFTAGFLIYLPFLLIDVVVSTTLMAMGMVMLPPAMVSMPFKLLLFITVDGWNLAFFQCGQQFPIGKGEENAGQCGNFRYYEPNLYAGLKNCLAFSFG